MRHFDEQQFKSTFASTPWDAAFVFDELDDIVSLWEALFNKDLDTHCPWRQKRVAREIQTPWMTNDIIGQLRFRDNCLKTARRSNNADD